MELHDNNYYIKIKLSFTGHYILKSYVLKADLTCCNIKLLEPVLKIHDIVIMVIS